MALLAAGEAATPAQRNPLHTPVKQVWSMQASACIDHTHRLGPWLRPVKAATFLAKVGRFFPLNYKTQITMHRYARPVCVILFILQTHTGLARCKRQDVLEAGLWGITIFAGCLAETKIHNASLELSSFIFTLNMIFFPQSE